MAYRNKCQVKVLKELGHPDDYIRKKEPGTGTPGGVAVFKDFKSETISQRGDYLDDKMQINVIRRNPSDRVSSVHKQN